jgi:hypothetical protein
MSQQHYPRSGWKGSVGLLTRWIGLISSKLQVRKEGLPPLAIGGTSKKNRGKEDCFPFTAQEHLEEE